MVSPLRGAHSAPASPVNTPEIRKANDMDVVFRYSDRIVVMHEGRILADGRPDEIRRNEAVAQTLMGTTPMP